MSTNGWGGARAGSGPRKKTLLEVCRSGTFRPTRHRQLLFEDDSLVTAPLPADAGGERLRELGELQLELLAEPEWSARRDALVRRFARLVAEGFGGSL